MQRLIATFLLTMAGATLPLQSFADISPKGSVIEHSGETGELIVSRDGVVYWLSTGDDLFLGDVVRAQNAEAARISFNGCEYVLPEKQDVNLNGEFCALASVEEPTMAQLASESGSSVGAVGAATAANAPLIVGGTVLSAGGIAAAINGGDGGTGSAASVAAGAAQATASSN